MFKKERQLYEARLETFKRHLESLFYPESMALKAEYCKFSPMVPFSEKEKSTYKPASIGLQWGRDWEKAWFKLEGKVPESWQGKTVCAKLNIGSEALIVNESGKALQAISVHSVWEPGFLRDRYELFESAKGGEDIKLWLEAAANQYFGLQLVRDPEPNDPNPHGIHLPTIKELNLVTFRKNVWHLYQDVELLTNLLHSLPETSVRRSRILKALTQGINGFNPNDEGVETFRKLLKPVVESKNGDTNLITKAVGHAHLDTAWLWPIEESIHKCARTFANQLNLIEKYPDYKFGASMAQHYEFMKDHYPALFNRIKEAIKKGQWEVQGGMWVEADCNLISGESMVRQLLYGKQFAENELGVDVKNLWLPDVFGYSAAMPQILKKSGIHYMVTQKISWNQFNKFPYHSFNWRGIDGSEVLVHFPPEDNYNSTLEPKSLNYAANNFAEKDTLDEFLTLFGIGDGGGGPTEEMIERGIRQKNLEGSPKVEFAMAKDFLKHLHEKKDELKTWVGELYLELHRGTYTTQAYNKLMNRVMENSLRDIEILFSCVDLKYYPSAELLSIWKKVLLYQFHDIIPGSSIAKVYEKSKAVYPAIKSQVQELLKKLISNHFNKSANKLTFINPSSSIYKGAVELPTHLQNITLKDSNGISLPVQYGKKGLIVQVNLDPLSYTSFEICTFHIEELPQKKDLILENEFIRYEFNSKGWLIKAYDKEYHRKIMLDNQSGNQLCLYEDRPVDWDAWDIDIYYENQLVKIAEADSFKVCKGAVQDSITFSYNIGNSPIEQEIVLGKTSKRIDFNTHVDWNERHKMLRAKFEVDVNSDTATFEIQSGFVKRSTHRNTQWDFAKFESVGHRFADLSEPDYGVALLNNCKYGYKVLDNILDINLLRAPTNPDPYADIEEHNFTYSLLPHIGNLIQSNVFEQAGILNSNPVLIEGTVNKQFEFPIKLSNYENVKIDAIKKAESNNDLVIRLIEIKGTRTKVGLSTNSKYRTACETDLMEKNAKMLEITNNNIELQFSPFEIKTIVIR